MFQRAACKQFLWVQTVTRIWGFFWFAFSSNQEGNNNELSCNTWLIFGLLLFFQVFLIFREKRFFGSNLNIWMVSFEFFQIILQASTNHIFITRINKELEIWNIHYIVFLVEGTCKSTSIAAYRWVLWMFRGTFRVPRCHSCPQPGIWTFWSRKTVWMAWVLLVVGLSLASSQISVVYNPDDPTCKKQHQSYWES